MILFVYHHYHDTCRPCKEGFKVEFSLRNKRRLTKNKTATIKINQKRLDNQNRQSAIHFSKMIIAVSLSCVQFSARTVTYRD